MTYHGKITTTFEDIVLVPLPCWLFLLFLIQLFAANRMNPVLANSSYTMDPEENELPKIRIIPANVPIQSSNLQPRKMVVLLSRSTGYLLLLITLCILLLSIDEMVHLGISGWGVGLLPFVPVTAVIASTLYFARNSLNALYPYDFKPGGLYGLCYYNKRLAGSFKSKITLRVLPFWTGMVVMEAIKLHTLLLLEASFPRKDSKYPASHQIVDVALLTSCMALVLLLTLVESLSPKLWGTL